uniref:Uncharacterized protein n=1 Tax=Ditylenchus dipsaci TaxID=166011 RepID=A0A915ERS5_9BILA
MYSFAQRPDTTVYDEPLYAHYLKAQCQDGEQVVRDLILNEPTAKKPITFFKQMTHHLVDLMKISCNKLRISYSFETLNK